MKHISLTLLLLAFTKLSLGQLQLTGTVTDLKKPDVITLASPFDESYPGTFQQDKPMLAKPNAKGSFSFNIKGTHPQFVVLNNRSFKNYLLLLPGKPLQITINNNTIATTDAENKLMLSSGFNNQTLLINRLQEYKKWPADSLVYVMLPRVEQELQSALKSIQKLNIPLAVKTLLNTELRYFYANKLSQFSKSIMQKISRKAAWKILGDAVTRNNPLPSASELQVSVAANTYLHYYALQNFLELGLQMREDKLKVTPIVEQQTGLPIDTVNKMANEFGEDYVVALISKKILPAYAYEKLLSNMVVNYAANKDLKFAKRLHADLLNNFPNSKNLEPANAAVTGLEKEVSDAEKSRDIVFLNNTEGITTLAALVAPYKGKIVYLDFWGTWCGPCMQEIINYSEPLKQRFAGKDIVFLYLEMDYYNNNDELKWKQFARLHNMKGYHLRMNGKQVENIWIDLLNTRDVPRLYPTYVIFDRQGNVINKDAKNPSDGEILYQQLETALNK